MNLDMKKQAPNAAALSIFGMIEDERARKLSDFWDAAQSKLDAMPRAEAEAAKTRMGEILIHKLGQVCDEEVATDARGRPMLPSDIHVDANVLKQVEVEAVAEALNMDIP